MKHFERLLIDKLFFKEKPIRRKKINYDFGDVDLISLLRKEQQKAKMIEEFFKEHEKLNKKEDKKSVGVDIAKLSLFLVASFPITGPLYFMWLMNMFRSMGLK